MTILDDELASQYQAECREHLVSLEAELLAIEKCGAAIDGERVDRAFRAVHSIRGGAVFLELPAIGALAHGIEDVLALIRSRKLLPTASRITLLLGASDRLGELVHGMDGSAAGSSQLVAELAALSSDIRAAEKLEASPIGPAPQGVRPLRMLLVEDDFTSRLLLQRFLSRYGECQVAVNGREAVAAFRSASERGQEFDLICMDIMMPEMDGHEAVRHMRALEKSAGIYPNYGARIIMTTTVDDVREVILCFKELCDEYLMKPIDLAKLLGHMKSYGFVR
jgi:two-component system chemotaxis response regulator CheY